MRNQITSSASPANPARASATSTARWTRVMERAPAVTSVICGRACPALAVRDNSSAAPPTMRLARTAICVVRVTPAPPIRTKPASSVPMIPPVVFEAYRRPIREAAAPPADAT